MTAVRGGVAGGAWIANQTWADTPDAGVIPVARLLADNDIVVNCVLQDPGNPLVFVTEDDLSSFTPGS